MVALERRRAAAESLRKHSLFGFQIHDASLAARVRDLWELLLATCGEPDQCSLVAESVSEIEEELLAKRDAREAFLLEPLRHFSQEMELLLDVGSGESDGVEDNDDDDARHEISDGDSASIVMDSQEEEAFIPLSPPVQAAVSAVASADVVMLSNGKATSTSKKGNGDAPQLDEDEVLCGVCCGADSLVSDPIVICELCGVAVHQTCYRLASLPEGDWYCHPCMRYMATDDLEKNVIPTHEITCEACCMKGGAFVPTEGGGWVHVACSMFLPELFMQDRHLSRLQSDHDDVQIVCGLDKLRPRRRLRCCFCKKSNDKGACAQCAVGKCVVAYHALCALQNGVQLRFMENKGHFGSGCLTHQAKFLSMEGLSGEDDEEMPAASDANDAKIKEQAKKANKKQPKKKKSRKSSWSDEDDDSEGSVTEDDGDQLDSESDGSQDSVSDDDENLNEQHKPQSGGSTVKKFPQRSSHAQKNSDGCPKKGKRSRQSTLSFMPAKATGPSLPAPAPAATQGSMVTTTSDQSSNNRAVLQTSIFAPAFYPPEYKSNDGSEKDYEYVMVLCARRPLGLGISDSTAKKSGVLLSARATSNPAVLVALKRGVLQDGDELFAFNDQMLKNSNVKDCKEIVIPTLTLPVRCWFRTKRKQPTKTPAVVDLANLIPASGEKSVIEPAHTPSQPQQLALSPAATEASPVSQVASVSSGSRAKESGIAEVALGSDWPWEYLRSDGKLAMNLFWKSLDTAFFLKKINKRKFADLQEQVEDRCGVRLDSSHPEYRQVRELLEMPRRERVPAYLVEFRKTRKQKQTFLSSDIFVGITSETKGDEVELDELTALAVGTTVTVAKRTWPGINKLGGAGRVKKVNEEPLANGQTRFTYDIAYVLGGNEKKVERKYISVVDLNKQEEENEGSGATATSGRVKMEPESVVKPEEDTSTMSVHFELEVERTAEEEKLLVLPEAKLERPPHRRRFQLQITTANNTVYCQRKVSTKHGEQEATADAAAKELLLHRHFDVKPTDENALLNECFTSKLLRLEDRVGDEVDEDDSESEEGEEDEIKKELSSLQEQFRVVQASNEQIFASLAEKVESEYASKLYRQRALQDIQWRNYERMYQELQAAKEQFDDSDDEDENGGVDGRVPGTVDAKRRMAEDDGEVSDSSNEDVSCGGLFVNKIKQEGNEVCALCELTGGDFAATDTGSVVHPQCAMYTPETFFKDGVAHGISQVAPERRRLVCTICGGRKGLSKIQCTSRKCTLAYHVSCAFVNGLLTHDPYYQAWCPRHLKTSGMAQFVDLPEHLRNQTDTDAAPQVGSGPRRGPKASKPRRSHQKKSRKESTPIEAASTGSASARISSSKTNRKRKRKTSSGHSSNAKTARGAKSGSSLGKAIAADDQEPRCARRLVIDLSEADSEDDSDHEGKAVAKWQEGRNPQQIFAKDDVVEVLNRDWPGINKPGGVARVRAVEVVSVAGNDMGVFYDVDYVVGLSKEKRVAAKYIRGYREPTAA